MNRLIAIGLDSATLDVILPLVKDGLLPTFKKLIQEGAYGVLESTIPPITPCAWETAMTGVNPGRHNIFDFFSYPANYQVEVLTSKDRAALAVWDYLAHFGKKSIVFNYPMGYPPPKIEGIFISGMNTPGVNTNFTFPQAIKKEILKKVPDYKIDVLGDHIINGRDDLYFAEIKHLTETHFRAASYLLKKYPWDLSLIFFTELDRVHHYFFRDQNRLREYYQLLDVLLKKLLTSYKKTTLLVFSDHGSAALSRDVFIEEFLVDWGLLAFRKTAKGLFSRIISNLIWKARSFVYKLSLAEMIIKLLPGRFFQVLVKLSSSREENVGNINWTKTKVYFSVPSSQGLKVNLRGREEQGIVAKEEYDLVRNYVIKKLLVLKDPSNGRKVIKNVYKRENIYDGPYIENAQDLIIETDSMYHLQKGIGRGKFGLASEAGVPKSAEHSREGMFVFYGEKITPGKKEKLKLVDIAAYILYILNLPIPSGIEGKINRKVLKEK